MKKILMRKGLPAFPGDDIEFVCRTLRTLKDGEELTKAGTITEIVRALGLNDRTSSGSPTSAYLRIRAALLEAGKLGRVRREGRIWATTP